MEGERVEEMEGWREEGGREEGKEDRMEGGKTRCREGSTCRMGGREVGRKGAEFYQRHDCMTSPLTL